MEMVKVLMIYGMPNSGSDPNESMLHKVVGKLSLIL